MRTLNLLNLDHPVERVFAQVLNLSRVTTWDVVRQVPGKVTPDVVHKRLVDLVGQVTEETPAHEGHPVITNPDPRIPDDHAEFMLRQCIKIFRERTVKYAGTLDDWDATFVVAAHIDKRHPADIADTHVAVKIARREAGDGLDHGDDSYRDSLIDEINYRILSIALRRVHPSARDDRTAFWKHYVDPLAKSTADTLLHALRAGQATVDHRVMDSVVMSLNDDDDDDDEQQETPLKERARIAKESLQAEILQTYDHLSAVLRSANEIGGVNHWRIPLKDAAKVLRPAVEELRTCPTCNQPTTKDVT